MLYVEILGRMNSPVGMSAMVDFSLYDDDVEIRQACLDQIVSHQFKPALGKYTGLLKNKDNVVINRAAYCLSALKDPAAIGPLIDALVTRHSFVIQKGSPGGIGSDVWPQFQRQQLWWFVGRQQHGDHRAAHSEWRRLKGLGRPGGRNQFRLRHRCLEILVRREKKPASLDARRDDAAK